MCFVYKHIHFTYIRMSPSKRGFPYTVQFVHQTGGVGIRPISNFTTLIRPVARGGAPGAYAPPPPPPQAQATPKKGLN